ncbi:hypothetical protein BH23CHL5_BH23CHL5_06040 [soil metagenome]
MVMAKRISYTMTAIGTVLTVLGALSSVSPIVTLTGMFLIVAGVVKIGMVQIWATMFQRPHADPQSFAQYTSLSSNPATKSQEAWHEESPTR